MANPPPSESRRFGKDLRLRTTREFERVFQGRHRSGDQNLLVFVRSNGLPHSRLGLSVSKKVGNAVRRNRWKRVLREAFRLSVARLPLGIDLVAIPRPDAQPVLANVQASLIRLASKLSTRTSLRSPGA